MPRTSGIEPDAMREEPLLDPVAEKLWTDPAAYQAFKQKQLARQPPAHSGPPISLEPGDWRPPEPLRNRRSHRRFAPEPVPAERFARALSSLRQDRTRPSGGALYASTGGLYGVDVYLHLKSGRVADFAGGIYFYDPAGHALRPIAGESEFSNDLHHHQNRAIHASSAFTLLFVFDSEVLAPLYGGASESLALVEAGMMIATFNFVAETLDLGLCPVGLIQFNAARRALRLGTTQRILQVVECGLKRADDPEIDPPLSVVELRRFLGASLPEYMVPSEFVMISEMPLTPNNKVDREALLKMGAGRSIRLGTEFAAASNELESKLVELWKRVLRADTVGIDDNFFDLGGDSLGVAEVNRLLLEEWNMDVPMVKLFQHPTVRSLARFLRDFSAQAPGPASTTVSELDQQALAWLRANPNDPRADAVAAKLKDRGLMI